LISFVRLRLAVFCAAPLQSVIYIKRSAVLVQPPCVPLYYSQLFPHRQVLCGVTAFYTKTPGRVESFPVFLWGFSVFMPIALLLRTYPAERLFQEFSAKLPVYRR
jgi:hypothetical protein